MKVADYIKEIEKLIANGDSESACEGLLHILQGKNEDLPSQIILLTGQYREMQRNKTLNIENDKQGMNRLSNSLLLMCKDIKSELGDSQISDIDLQELHTIQRENQIEIPLADSFPILN